MKGNKLVEIFKEGNIVIPMYYIKHFSDLNINWEEFVFLMYLCGKGEKTVFNPVMFSEELNMDLTKVMVLVSGLSDKNLVEVSVSKNENGVMEEVLKLDGFYSKISLITMGEVNKENTDVDNSDIFSTIEKEFGRTLSPMELEISKAWLENGFSETMIKEAIREASFNGVSNLRYIDKILYTWGKNNITTQEDIEKNRQKHREEKEKIDENVDMEIVDWNWFDED